MAPCKLTETWKQIPPHRHSGGTVLGLALLLSACSGAKSGSATLTWNAPTRYTDGSPLTDLAGYRVYCGTNPFNLVQTADIKGAASTRYVVTGLTTGTTYCVVRAYNASGQVSAPSNMRSKTI
jgi:hypothetical protein